MFYGRRAWEVVAYTYEADFHCLKCTIDAFGEEPRDGYKSAGVTDSEGNTPNPVFSSDMEEAECCGTCGEWI